MGKREDILSATRDLIAELGIESLSFSKIFERAKVGSGTVYNYFANKEELVATLYREIGLHLSNEVLVDYDPDRSIKERFFHLARNLTRFVAGFQRELSVHAALAKSPYIPPNDRWQTTPSLEAISSLLIEGQEKGELWDMDPPVAISLVTAALTAVVNGQLVGKYGAVTDAPEQAIEACWRAIAKP